MKTQPNQKTLLISAIIIVLLAVSALFFFQSNKDFRDEELVLNPKDSLLFNDQAQLKKELSETAQMMASNIASPAEIASAIKFSDYRFSSKILLNSDIAKYHTPKEKALAMGGIGADLMYISCFKQQSSTIRPLNQIRQLSNSLYLSQFFDFESLKDLATASISKEEADSLLMMSTLQINGMERELLTPQRIETGLFMVLGAWTEGLHLLNHYAQTHNDETLIIRLGDQRICLKILETWLIKFEKNNEVKEVLAALQPLKKELYAIEVKTENIGQPKKTYDMEGNETTYQITQTTPIINSEQVDAITEEVEKFRKKIFIL